MEKEPDPGPESTAGDDPLLIDFPEISDNGLPIPLGEEPPEKGLQETFLRATRSFHDHLCSSGFISE